MLDELNIKATFFILGWEAEHNPKLIKLIHSKGHEIAAHSYWHHNATLLSPQDFEKDLKLCLSRLQDLTGEKVTSYRAPAYSLRLKDQWAFDILAANGIKVDSSVKLSFNKNRSPFIIKSGDQQILEFPLVKSKYGIPYSGGGYFRLMPQPLLSNLFESEEYRLLYFHPRDFDPDYPFFNLFSLFRNWLNKVNTNKCMDRLKPILLQHPTQTIRHAATQYHNIINQA